jgi:3-methyladenine DNA glycosylase/8-oxoguanine DNA glycosylase
MMAAAPAMRPSTSWMPQARNCTSEIGPMALDPGDNLRLIVLQEANGLDRLGRVKRGHAGVQRFAQARVALRQKLPGRLQHRPEIAQFLHGLTRHAQDEGQPIGRVRKANRRIWAVLGQCLGVQAIQSTHGRLCAGDG